MKILAFSDLHRDVEATRKIVGVSAEADVVVGAGDFATRGEGAADTLDILREIEIPTVLVFGNHDNAAEMHAHCGAWDNGHLLHGNALDLGGVTFFGLGGEIPRRNKSLWNESLSEEDAGRMLQDCPDRAVLITHTPPHGCADLQRDGTHEGSNAIRAVIKEKRPALHLCGHIHFSWGASGTISQTPVHNLGPTVTWFEV